MPVQPTYPGVYVEEIPSGVHTITGVATSITAFAGQAQKGPTNQAARILSFADYQRTFGDLASYSDMSYAVSQFFLNGGSQAQVIRLIGKNTTHDTLILTDGGSPSKNVLQIDAIAPGETDRYTDVFTANVAGATFSLIVVSTSKTNPADITNERYDNLVMDHTKPDYVVTRVNGVSKFVTVTDLIKDDATLPAATTPYQGTLTSGKITADLTKIPSPTENSFRIGLDGSSPLTVTFPTGSPFNDVPSAATSIQTAVRALKPADPVFQGFTCVVDPSDSTKLVLASGTYGQSSSVNVRDVPGDNLAKDLQLTSTGAQSLQTDIKKLQRLSGGTGGSFDPSEVYDLFIADRSKRLGIYALEAVDLFNLMCLPGITDVGVLADAAAYCEERRAFLIVDAPHNATPPPVSPNDMYNDITSTAAGKIIPKTSYAAIYYPWVQVADPLNGGALKTIPPGGTIAGVYARTDSTRGVWKAPAGTEAALVSVQGLEYLLTDAENGILNPQGVNCLRVFPAYGPVSWGSRTLKGSDDAADDYKYVPVRRLALYIEESLYRGTQWVVFEPNDEPLWSQIRLNVGAFMQDLFRKGAFQGKTPQQAYLVKCDSETTTQNDINLGIVNILVGFAPLKPAEFVIIQIQQLAGQIQV